MLTLHLLKIKKSNEQEEPKKTDNSLYDLFYLNLNDFLNEYNSKRVSSPYKLMRNYMEQNNIVSAEKLLRPIIIPPNVIKKDSKEYIDEIILNKYLRQLGIIKNNEKVNNMIDDVFNNILNKNK